MPFKNQLWYDSYIHVFVFTHLTLFDVLQFFTYMHSVPLSVSLQVYDLCTVAFYFLTSFLQCISVLAIVFYFGIYLLTNINSSFIWVKFCHHGNGVHTLEGGGTSITGITLLYIYLKPNVAKMNLLWKNMYMY